MSTDSTLPGRGARPQPGDDGWEPTGLARPAYLLAVALMTAGRNIKAYLVTHPAVRARLGSGPVVLAIGMSAWTVAGAITLLAGQDLFTAVLYAATAGLCTTMTLLGFLFHAMLDATSSTNDGGAP